MSDPWNFCNFTGFSLLIIHTFLNITGAIEVGSSSFQSLLSVAMLLLWLCALGYLRVFDATRHLVRLVLEVMKEMWSFVLLLVLLWMAYAIYPVHHKAGNI